MNARNYNIIAKFNKRSLYPLVDDKVQTKKLANSIDINTPHMIGIVEHQYEVKDLLQLIEGQSEFVIKPAHGSEGKGVLVVAHYENGIFTTPSGKEAVSATAPANCTGGDCKDGNCSPCTDGSCSDGSCSECTLRSSR